MWFLLACGPGSAPPVPVVAPPTVPVTSEPPMVECDPPLCAREPSFDDYAGGRSLRLDVLSVGAADPLASLDPTVSVSLIVSRAVPGEPIHLFVGDLCGLDCPVDRDGACFQPADPVELGVVTADAAGTAALTVAQDPAWLDRWLVFQATAPDRSAVSQAWVDRVRTWFEPISPSEVEVEVSPVTLHAQLLFPYEVHGWWPVAAGRRVVGRYDVASSWNAEQPRVTIVSGGSRADPVSVAPLEEDTATLLAPSGILWTAFAYADDVYMVDWSTEPLSDPVDWSPDADGDVVGAVSGPSLSLTRTRPGGQVHARGPTESAAMV